MTARGRLLWLPGRGFLAAWGRLFSCQGETFPAQASPFWEYFEASSLPGAPFGAPEGTGMQPAPQSSTLSRFRLGSCWGTARAELPDPFNTFPCPFPALGCHFGMLLATSSVPQGPLLLLLSSGQQDKGGNASSLAPLHLGTLQPRTSATTFLLCQLNLTTPQASVGPAGPGHNFCGQMEWDLPSAALSPSLGEGYRRNSASKMSHWTPPLPHSCLSAPPWHTAGVLLGTPLSFSLSTPQRSSLAPTEVLLCLLPGSTSWLHQPGAVP